LLSQKRTVRHFDFLGQRTHPRTDVVRAISEAIKIIQSGQHDPLQAHERVKTFYNWNDVAIRTERVYDSVMKSPQMDFMTRIERNMALGPFAGLIYTTILLVQCLFFLFLEWWIPRDSLHFVHHDWHMGSFAEVCFPQMFKV